MIPPVAEPNGCADNELGYAEILRAQGRAQKGPESAPEALAIDADLAAVVVAWPTLPEATRQRILALARG